MKLRPLVLGTVLIIGQQAAFAASWNPFLNENTPTCISALAEGGCDQEHVLRSCKGITSISLTLGLRRAELSAEQRSSINECRARLEKAPKLGHGLGGGLLLTIILALRRFLAI